MKEKTVASFDTHKLKRYFVTGLIILLPVALTILIVVFFFNLLTNPFEGIMISFLRSAGIFNKGFYFLSEEQLIRYTSKLLIFTFLIATTICIGFFARLFFINWIIRVGEAIVNRIPFIGSLYKTSQDVIKTIFTSNTKSFKQPVLVPYPNEYTYCLGLITREHIEGLEGDQFKDPVAVFIPTTPNPTSGFLLLFEREKVTYLDMSIEGALKYVISCGVIMTPLKPMTKE
ncbi:DUF502 domain-containing protein [Chlamydiales bacterium]|nr:DUF502 domain-containing protein [Chlamydiales bacterium]